MLLHFENVTLIDPEALTAEPGSLTVEDGVITARDGATPEGATCIDGGGAMLAPGLIDWGVKVGEPGERHEESYASAGRAAAAGGITTMVVRPDTAPTLDSPEGLVFAAQRATDAAPVRVRHMAALTKARAGAEMVEIGFLHDAGAVAFTDGVRVLRNTKVLQRAMTYARAIGALIVGHPQEPLLSQGAVATSGKFATLYGLPAVSPMAEVMGLERDLALVAMTGVRWHADQITVAASLPPLARAHKAGLDVTAGTSIHHLTLNTLDIAGYRSFFRLTPPLRDETDRQAMVQAIDDGAIDVIASFHTPQDEESKRLPFEAAAPGAVGLQTLLPAAIRLWREGVSLPRLIRAMTLAPAQRLGLPQGRLSVGAPADLVLFDPDAPFVLDRWTLLSKCKNTPFDGARLEGRVRGLWIGGAPVAVPHGDAL